MATRQLLAILLGGILSFTASQVLADEGPGTDPDPRFSLSFDVDHPGSSQHPGSTVRFDSYVVLTVDSEEAGVQGWAISVAVDGGDAVEASIEGTISMDVRDDENGLRDRGFEVTELAVGPNGETGVISALNLSWILPTTLPAQGEFRLFRMTVEAEAPTLGACDSVELVYRDGMRGEGNPVENLVTYQGEACVPVTSSLDVELCGTTGGWTPFDCNDDGRLDMSDPVCTLSMLFLGGERPACRPALDFDESGVIDISDPVAALGFLFFGSAPPFRGRNCVVYEDCPTATSCSSST